MFLSCLAACDAEIAHAELLKAPYKTPSVRAHHHSLLEPQNPLTAPKWPLLLFFVLQSASYKWPHSTPVWLLTALWILLPERTDVKKYTSLWGRGLGHSVSAFRLCMNNLKGFHLDSKFFFGCQRVEKLLKWKLLGRGASAKLPKHYGTLLKNPVDENWNNFSAHKWPDTNEMCDSRQLY